MKNSHILQWETMFRHEVFVKYPFAEIPLNRDCQLIEIKKVFEAEGLNVYAILTQGFNLYDESNLVHCEKENHVCLNVLGLPFAEIFDIEKAAKKAVEKELHSKCELYMDAACFQSLQRQYGTEIPSALYKRTKLSNTDSQYYYCALNDMLAKLKKEPLHDS